MKASLHHVAFLSLLIVVNNYSMAVWTAGEVPFVPTPLQVVDRMLEIARLTPEDVIYDLGSGDGAIIIRAAKSLAFEESA